jgi:hypothetical protein
MSDGQRQRLLLNVQSSKARLCWPLPFSDAVPSQILFKPKSRTFSDTASQVCYILAHSSLPAVTSGTVPLPLSQGLFSHPDSQVGPSLVKACLLSLSSQVISGPRCPALPKFTSSSQASSPLSYPAFEQHHSSPVASWIPSHLSSPSLTHSC